MSTYAIGDLQGCYRTLRALLKEVRFNRKHDQLWLVGDLVNRGPASLECLRYLYALAERVTVVLGNHDLHFIAVACGAAQRKRADTLDDLLDANDLSTLVGWLSGQKLLHLSSDFVMVHAGLQPQWSWSQAEHLANEVALALQSEQRAPFLQAMYGNEPDVWSEALVGNERMRVVVNTMTRMRTLSADGRMDLRFKGGLDSLPPTLRPWFQYPTQRDRRTVLAGHWSALGLHHAPGFIGLDSGCAWGQKLTALRLEDQRIFQVDYAESVAPAGWD